MELLYSYIYALKDPRTQKIHYIGQSINPKKRLVKHFCDRARRSQVMRQWIEYLWQSQYKPLLVILEKVTREKADERERYWARFYQDRGEPLFNYNLVEKKRFRPPRSEETKAKISLGHLGKPKKGHSQTEETKAKISRANKGRPRTAEWIEKMASQLRGIPWSDEKRAKIMAGRKAAGQNIKIKY